jgi:uncharacterized protein (DUF58 family)
MFARSSSADSKLQSESGSGIHPESSSIVARGSRAQAEGSRLQAQGSRLQAQGCYTDMARLLGARQLAQDIDLFSRAPARAQMQGESRSRYRGRGMEFEEARVYSPGDDVRTIDWRVTARTGIPHTKVFREERERPVHILVDQRSNMFFGSQKLFKSVFAAEIAAILAWAALEGSDRIGGQIVGDNRETDFRAKRSRHSVLRFIRELHSFNHDLPGGTSQADIDLRPSIAAMLAECQRLVRPGTALFVISDFIDIDEEAQRSLSMISRHADITLIRVLDPLETEIPAVGRTRLTDGIKEAEVVLDRATVKRLQAHLKHQNELLQNAAILAKAGLISTSTEDLPLAVLRKHYPR